MKTVKNWVIESITPNFIELICDEKHSLRIYVLEETLFRVMFQKEGKLQLDRTWTVAPGSNETPIEGRSRFDLSGFSCPNFSTEQISKHELRIETTHLRLSITQPLCLHWEHKLDGQWQSLVHDRKTGAYQLGVNSYKNAHFMNFAPDTKFYGLGEKSGWLERTKKRFEMRNLDAMGYDAENTDPLYKHIPFFIAKPNSHLGTQGAYGVFYDNLAHSWFDLGNELDNYHVRYTSYRAEDGDLDYYFIYGTKIKSVTQQFVNLTGRTLFGPKWGLGYSGSTMQYTDLPDSQKLLTQFLDKTFEHQIACDSFQMSSGYTSIGDKRYVFNWNKEKFPDIFAFTNYFHSKGVHLAANIKPCLLHDHPYYQEAKSNRLFIQDSQSDSPEFSVFWDAEGSHLDFTQPKTIEWWKKQVTEQLLSKGIESTWNDNNEYEIWDSGARCFGFGQEIPINLIRPIQPLLMMRSSFEAQKEFAPEKRPYLISRSGCPGMQRYVQTWSGDNRTNWNTLKFNIQMGLGMSLSGLYNVGHDVGGFSGQRPDSELFIRWVQNGIMNPRFTIHSWNDDGSVTEPWMHSEATPVIQDIIALRYKLLPYIYDAFYKACAYNEPMLRPTFLDHEHDLETFVPSDDYLFGQDLLIASVVEPGARKRTVYLPDNTVGWYDFYSEQWLSAKQTITLEAPLERIPLLVKAGTCLPMSERIGAVNAKLDDKRVIKVYPFKGVNEGSCLIYDDDGESYNYLDGFYLKLNIAMKTNGETIELTVETEGSYTPAYKTIDFVVVGNDSRQLFVNGQKQQNCRYIFELNG
ncbi:glycoside hydrolase family 31 protein [Thorsellia kenyensis]|uniref:TIM-barrel domain-containing protein n=1 Tax=Thorsellia kenyensis TaxID=1549888 RepID=A0ABV6CC80_9GAMM